MNNAIFHLKIDSTTTAVMWYFSNYICVYYGLSVFSPHY